MQCLWVRDAMSIFDAIWSSWVMQCRLHQSILWKICPRKICHLSTTAGDKTWELGWGDGLNMDRLEKEWRLEWRKNDENVLTFAQKQVSTVTLCYRSLSHNNVWVQRSVWLKRILFFCEFGGREACEKWYIIYFYLQLFACDFTLFLEETLTTV